MDTLDNDERLEYAGVADPFFEVDCDPNAQTGSDWYALALSASLGGKALHGFTFATTSETVAKTTYAYAEKHTCAWIRTNEVVTNVDAPGEAWDEVVRPTHLHSGVKTGSQLAMMFDTGTWESSSATRAKNTAYIAAGMVTHGMPVSKACEVAGAIAGEDVPEAAVMNTVVPVSHLKREAAGVAKSSHSIFSRMNAQRYISWVDTQLHEGMLPAQASLDWAKVTVLGRYIAEANMRYDPKFVKLAQLTGVPYTVVKGAWAYVDNSDYILDSPKWAKIVKPVSDLIAPNALETAYSTHTQQLTTQIMRTYNELASETSDANLETILALAEKLRTRARTSTKSIAVGTSEFAATTSHTQSAALAAANTATSGTSFNALSQAFSEFALTNSQLKIRASGIITQRRRIDDVLGELEPFFIYLGSRHTWMRALEILDALIGNYKTSLDRLNRLHRSMTQTSATIAVDVPITSRSRHAMAPHIIELLKRGLISPGPQIALPRYVTSFKGAVERGDHAKLLRALGDHLTTYKDAWATRYEDWSRAYGMSGIDLVKSVQYGGAASAFRTITSKQLLMANARFIDGANVKTSYLYKQASDYARKRRLRQPNVPITPVGTAAEYAKLLDNQYNAQVSFVDVEGFVYERLKMFADDLTLEIEPRIPESDAPGDDVLQSNEEDAENEALILAMLEGDDSDDDDGGVFKVTLEKVEKTYPSDISPDAVARANGYDSFEDAFEALRDGARWDTEAKYSQQYLNFSKEAKQEEEFNGLTIS